VRIVSLLPAATEIVAALGALDALVGVTHECDYPPAVRALPRVTSSAVPAEAAPDVVDAAVRERAAEGAPLFALDDALIEALAPDLLLTQALCDVCAVNERDVCALAERLDGAPRVVTLAGTSIAGVGDDVRRVAAALGREAAGEAIVAALEARLAAVAAVMTENASRPRVALVEWTDPVFLAGHWGPEMVRRAGGVDPLVAEGSHSTTVSHEALAAAGLDVVIVAPCGYDLERAAAEARGVLADPRWAWLAGREVWAVDANAMLSRPGPRLVDGVEALARVLHPDRIGAPDARLARRIR
jgi:iron complex transport system substrate-binding protein